MKNKEYKYASFKHRLFAYILDRIALAIILAPILKLFFGEKENTKSIEEIMKENPNISFLDLIFYGINPTEFTIAALTVAIVFIIFWVRFAATPAKMLFKMQIVDLKTGNNPTFSQSALRYLGYVVSAIPVGLGFIWIAFDDKKQGWHDKIAGTIVIIPNNNIDYSNQDNNSSNTNNDDFLA